MGAEEQFAAGFGALTKRQRDVLELLVVGLTNKEIGDLLSISANTVKTHVAAIFEAVGASNRTEVVRFVHENERGPADNRQHDDSRAGAAAPQQDPHDPLHARRPLRLAVLPFVDRSSDANHEYFADGIVDELINGLSRLPEVRVAARTTSFYFRGRSESMQEIGKRLGVWAVVEGSLRLDDTQLCITATLATTADGFTLWSEAYRRHVSGALSIQEEIAAAIVDALRLQVVPSPAKPLTTNQSADVEAYHLFWRGRHFWNQRTPASIPAAMQHYQQALDRDADYALAYVGLADAYNHIGAFSTYPPCDAFSKAKAAARRAVELDPELGEAHASLAYAVLYYDWDLAGAEAGFKKAIELNPGYALGYGWHSLLCLARGEYDEAVRLALRGYALDPLSVAFMAHIGRLYYASGAYDSAQEYLHRALDMEPDNTRAHLWLTLLSLQQEDCAAARRHGARLVELTAGHPFVLGAHGLVLARAGEHDAAREVLTKLQEMARQRYVSPMNLATVAIGLGDKDAAFAELRRAYDERCPQLLHLASEPTFDCLREDERFDELARRLPVPMTERAFPNWLPAHDGN